MRILPQSKERANYDFYVKMCEQLAEMVEANAHAAIANANETIRVTNEAIGLALQARAIGMQMSASEKFRRKRLPWWKRLWG